jgi:hypothetical protein
MAALDTHAIEKFFDLVKRAAQARSREIRLEMADATILTAEIATVLGRMTSLETKQGQTGTVTMDAGSFR